MTAVRRLTDGYDPQTTYAFDGAIAVPEASLMYYTGDDVKPASSQADQLSEGANQALFASKFAGLAGLGKRLDDPAQDNFPILKDVIAEFDCTSAAWEVGDLIAAKESAGGIALENIAVKKTTDPFSAIGHCVKRAGSAVTRVTGRFVSRVTPYAAYGLSGDDEIAGVPALRSYDKIITTAQVLALFTTAIEVVPAPPAGYYLEFVSAEVFLDYNSAAYASDAGEDLVIRYTDASGAIVSQSLDGTLFHATADALFHARPVNAAASAVVDLAAAGLFAHVLVGNWITGNSPLKVRTLYRRHRKASLEAIA